MKTSTVMKLARSHLRLYCFDSDCETFACWAVSHAVQGKLGFECFNQALNNPKVKAFSALLPKRIQGFGNAGLSEYKWFDAMSYEDQQNFRFLLLCMAEEYFKSIGD